MFHSFRDAVLLARRQPGLYFAALLDQQTILDAFGSASSLWQGWLYRVQPAVCRVSEIGYKVGIGFWSRGGGPARSWVFLGAKDGN